MDLSRTNTRDKSKIKCYRCRGFGHYQRDCPVKINELRQEAIQEILQMHFESEGSHSEEKLEEPTIEIYSSSGQVEEIEEKPEEDTRQSYSYTSWSAKDRYANLYGEEEPGFP